MTICYDSFIQSISVSQFKAQCLSVLDNIAPEGFVITRRGKPIARVVPEGSTCAPLIGSMKGKLMVKGDILSSGVRWNAQS